MTTTTMMRLREAGTGRSLIVDTAAGRAFSDTDGDGKIGRGEALSAEQAQAAVAAAREVERLFVAAIPGTITPNADFEVRGPVSAAEARAFASGQALPVEREPLKQHLDFFDGDGDGKMTLRESIRGFRAVGMSPISAVVKAVGAGVIFGRLKEGFAVDVEKIATGRRYAASTGIYDRDGRIDEARLSEYLDEFAKKGGSLTQDEVMGLLARKAQAGTVSKNQFKSLFTVCEKLNGDKTVTAAQFRGLFDGSLLWLAASVADEQGRRRLDRPEAAGAAHAAAHAQAPADERAALASWLDGVKGMPRMLRTKEAAALYDALANAGLSSSADLPPDADASLVAAKAGLSAEQVRATTRKCPFGL